MKQIAHKRVLEVQLIARRPAIARTLTTYPQRIATCAQTFPERPEIKVFRALYFLQRLL